MRFSLYYIHFGGESAWSIYWMDWFCPSRVPMNDGNLTAHPVPQSSFDLTIYLHRLRQSLSIGQCVGSHIGQWMENSYQSMVRESRTLSTVHERRQFSILTTPARELVCVICKPTCLLSTLSINQQQAHFSTTPSLSL